MVLLRRCAMASGTRPWRHLWQAALGQGESNPPPDPAGAGEDSDLPPV